MCKFFFHTGFVHYFTCKLSTCYECFFTSGFCACLFVSVEFFWKLFLAQMELCEFVLITWAFESHM